MRHTICSVVTALLLTGTSMQLKAGIEVIPVSLDSAKTHEATQVNALLFRLDEINMMDRSALSSSERKQLRKEVRAIKKELSGLGGGVYLSVGAIIIILLLLILLL